LWAVFVLSKTVKSLVSSRFSTFVRFANGGEMGGKPLPKSVKNDR
jgi:hypothetical protein